MIRIKRPRKSPAALSAKDDSKKTERQRAIAFYDDPNRDEDAHYNDFSAYSDFSVKQELQRVFNEKCAYCEKPIPGRNSQDIEHYRPKSAISIKGKIEKPGYYWLAASWPNLYLSCKDCNSLAGQPIAPKKDPVEIADGTIRVIGKGNYFPTHDNWYARTHNVRRKEKPLIANPSSSAEKPEKLFEFHDDGNISPKAKRGINKKKAEETIRILGLDSLHLVQARAAHARMVNLDLEGLRRASQRLDETKSQGNKDDVAFGMEKMVFHLEPTRPFLGLTRSMIRSYFKEHGISLAELKPHLG